MSFRYVDRNIGSMKFPPQIKFPVPDLRLIKDSRHVSWEPHVRLMNGDNSVKAESRYEVAEFKDEVLTGSRFSGGGTLRHRAYER